MYVQICGLVCISTVRFAATAVGSAGTVYRGALNLASRLGVYPSRRFPPTRPFCHVVMSSGVPVAIFRCMGLFWSNMASFEQFSYCIGRKWFRRPGFLDCGDDEEERIMHQHDGVDSI